MTWEKKTFERLPSSAEQAKKLPGCRKMARRVRCLNRVSTALFFSLARILITSSNSNLHLNDNDGQVYGRVSSDREHLTGRPIFMMPRHKSQQSASSRVIFRAGEFKFELFFFFFRQLQFEMD
jgi:hypothetical protein